MLTFSQVALAIDYTFTTIDYPGADETSIFGINNSGQIVGSYTDSTGQHGFILDGGNFTTIDYPGAQYSYVRGINDSGQIVGSYTDSTGQHGFILDGGNFTTIDYPGGWLSSVHGINDSGQIVGRYADSGYRGFLFDGGNFTRIHYSGALATSLYDINDSGQIVGYYYYPTRDRFGLLLNGGNFTTIDYLGAKRTSLYGINNSGQIVGSYDSSGGHGLLLDGGNFTIIDYPGARRTRLADINDSGQIVGDYYDYYSRQHGFLASPGDPVAKVVYKDENGNGSYDDNVDIPIPDATVTATLNGAEVITFSGQDGTYSLNLTEPGTYDLNVSYKEEGQETISLEGPETITIPGDENPDISVNYKWVNYGPSLSPSWQLWHAGPIFEDKDDIVLVHGFRPSWDRVLDLGKPDEPDIDHFGQLDELLQKKKFDQNNVWRFEYKQHYSIDTYANDLASAIQEIRQFNDYQKVNVIGYSMGGLVTRQYIENGYRDNIDKFITVATPHYGAEPGFISWIGALRHLDARQMRYGSSYLWNLNSSWQYTEGSLSAIGGSRNTQNTDGVVNISSASLVACLPDGKINQKENFTVFNAEHPGAFNNWFIKDIANISDENDPVFVHITSFLDGLPTQSNEPKQFGGEPYVSFCFEKTPPVFPDFPYVEVKTTSDETHIYRPGSGLYPSGDTTDGTHNGKDIWWFEASPDDHGEIKIYYAPGVFKTRQMEQGQSIVISDPIDNSSNGQKKPSNVAYSLTPINSEDGGFAVAGNSGDYTEHGVFIPGGALLEDTTIGISEPDNDHGLPSAVDFGPSGTVFNQPATLTLEFKNSDIPPGYGANDMKILTWNNNKWDEVSGSVVDSSNYTISAQVDHFSTYAVGVDVTPPTILTNVPTGDHLLNEPFNFWYSAEDDISGVKDVTAKLNGNPVSPLPLNLTHLGLNTFEITATDNAGNSTTETYTFNVGYAVDWQPPIRQLDESESYEYTMNDGSTLPIKWILKDYNQVIQEDASLCVKVVKDADEVVMYFTSGDGSESIRYNPDTGQYIVNLHTKDLDLGTYRIELWGGGENNGFLGNLLDPVQVEIVERGKAKGKK